jgi:hypothetical protein
MIRTQKIFGLLALVLSFLYQGCGPAGPTEIWDTAEKPAEETKIVFTIKNESSYTLTNITWQNNTVSGSLTPGAAEAIDISADASGYVFFTKSGASPMNLRTQEVVTVSKAENTTFTITNNTVVIEVDNPDNTGTLATIVPLVTTLTIKNMSFTDLLEVKWQAVGFTTNATEDAIAMGTTVSKTVSPGSGYIYFKRKSNPITARTGDIVTVEKDKALEFVFTDTTLIAQADNPDNRGTLKDLQPTVTTLLIKNQSFSDLLSVEWQGVSFAENTLENSITLGKSVTKTVNPGYGYIYFKRKVNPAAARTKDIITIEKNETLEFVFTDTTLIVEANNPDNTGTLKDMQTTVVFFDDAEGEVQGYAERKNSDYYASESNLPNYVSSAYYYSYNYFAAKNGKKSIAVGGSTDAKLRLTVTLDRPAKLSFWYANKGNGNGTFLIDEETKNTWTGNINWSKGEYTLSAGTHEIVWAKDGYSSGTYYYYYYLSLDDILVVYTE